MAEKWIGTYEGTKRGLSLFEGDLTADNSIKGVLSFFDNNGTLRANVDGKLNDKKLFAKLNFLDAKQSDDPTEGTAEGVLSDSGKTIDGSWTTNKDHNGKITLHHFPVGTPQTAQLAPQTLEWRIIPIEFKSFQKKDIKALFQMLQDTAKAINSQPQPIYGITYDIEEDIRTYNEQEFFCRFDDAEKIRSVTFDYVTPDKSHEIQVTITDQPNLSTKATNSIIIKSVTADLIQFLPDTIRGKLTKVKNTSRWVHRWLFELAVQIIGVVGMLGISYFASKKLSAASLDIQPYVFFTFLILLSNFWTYIGRMFFLTLNRYFPVIEILNRKKNKVLPIIVFGTIGSVFATLLIYITKVAWNFFVP